MKQTAKKKSLWRFLNHPIIFKISQHLLAPGNQESITREIRHGLGPSLERGRDLDVGCGPSSYLWNLGLRPVGLDYSHPYSVVFRKKSRGAVTGSSARLPFGNDCFDRVWTFGLFHHLPDDMVEQTLREMHRVVRPKGRLIVFDGVMPHTFWDHPFAWILNKLDRGRYMRAQDATEFFLFDRKGWQVKRFQYTPTGLEGLLCIYQKTGL